MDHTENRRRFSRIAFTAQTEIHQDGNRGSCELLDLSLKGLLASKPEQMQINPENTCQIIITLADEAMIRMHAKLTREDVALDGQSHLGFSCEEIDVDSISHLRRLVELNLGDPEASNRELFELIAMRSNEKNNNVDPDDKEPL